MSPEHDILSLPSSTEGLFHLSLSDASSIYFLSPLCLHRACNGYNHPDWLSDSTFLQCMETSDGMMNHAELTLLHDLLLPHGHELSFQVLVCKNPFFRPAYYRR